jgi:hypothetical protein
MGKQTNTWRVLMAKPEGKRPLGRPRLIWEDYIKRSLKEMVWGRGLDSSGSEQGEIVGFFEHDSEIFIELMDFLTS